ncbi:MULTISPECIES: GTP-binding protein [unclassified Clostridium]|uniref:GTP-binding protein n=1 Tax=unclassified Clostridium TaxID=2614128 RepID=UPI0018974732|nr:MULTISPECIES: GTP-binding protein [unclassified Clostridium]MBP3916728.1 GTP-binding protein [Clostridium sp.]
MSVKVEIFSGFLGAGKTQLIKKLIEEGYYKEKIAIIENEFGEVSIDGVILKRTNTLVKEINAGCICCQVTGDFKESILDVVENCNVDRLLVEPTGVAKLSDIKKVFNEKELKGIAEVEKAITVVDAEKFDLYLTNFKSFFINQIKNADIIILSRTQNVSNEEVKRLQDEINKLNSKAIIMGRQWNNTKSEELIPKVFLAKDKGNTKEKVNFRKSNLNVGNIKKEKSEENLFESFALKIDRDVSKEELLSKFNFIKNSFEFGEIIRAKGIVNTKNGKEQFDYTLSEINMQKIAYRGDTIISFIGTNLNKEKIKKFFS